SITTADEKIRRVVEPGTPPASKLFDAISRFSARGVACGINVDPIIPLVTDSASQFDCLIAASMNAGAKHVFGSVLRMRSDIWERIKTALSILHIPDFELKYRS